jgi:hypothetical protein
MVQAQAKGLIVLLTYGNTIHFSFQSDRCINATSTLKRISVLHYCNIRMERNVNAGA